jgi:hypothetical protein
MPEQQEIVTGAVLIATPVIFTGGANLRRQIFGWMNLYARKHGTR